MKSEREAVAYHEAGHAVIARSLGLEVTSVTIIPDLDHFDITYYHQFATYRARNADLATQISTAETDAMVSLAGPAAEYRYRRPKSVQELAQEMATWRSDGEMARDRVAHAVDLKHDLLTARGPECDGELFDELCDEFDRLCAELFDQFSTEVEILVDKHWPAIERVANALLEFYTLNATDVDDLIAGTFLRTRTVPKMQTIV
jgi:ATP-dependent Zn protease